MTSSIRSAIEWILDNGYSYHLYTDKGLFYTLNEVQGGNVLWAMTVVSENGDKDSKSKDA